MPKLTVLPMATSSPEYDFARLEPHWQAFWEKHRTFAAREDAVGRARPKYYVLDMFPYPSGAGLHIGHPVNYFPTDILARFKRAQGYNVLHPQGWDAFGLPTEQYAIQTGTHPAETTKKNIARFREQLRRLGFVYDWDREVNTTDPHYFRWTQWIFLQLFQHGLAYVDEKPVWYCPNLGTVLANEEVLNTDDGPRSERGSHPVERRNLRQWVLRITAYADKLLAGLDQLNWPESTKKLQANWIGRSEGAEVHFALRDFPGEQLTVFTTRPDTLFGATYMVVSPEHPLLAKIVTPAQRAAVAAYQEQARSKSDLERAELAKEKTGVFTGAYAINPVNGREIPIWVADYVLMTYGTGAIMAVPAHDERDFEFARKFGLPINIVVLKELTPGLGAISRGEDLKEPYCGEGVAVSSPVDGWGLKTPGFEPPIINGLSSSEAKKKITAWLESKGLGKKTVNFKLRDWLFSRQRYWGEPFPIIWVRAEDYAKLADFPQSPLREFLPKNPVTFIKDGETWHAIPITSASLPLELPVVDNFQPAGTGESPLSKAGEWLYVRVNLATGEVSRDERSGAAWIEGVRETNTMPQWAGSCWYYLRYLDPRDTHALLNPEREAYWGMPDLYIGGAEHAVLHLLYARFWHQFLHDIGVTKAPEPFPRLFHQGMLLGEDGQKMSKSRGNVINPDDFITLHGADALRVFLMFLGPVEDTKPWNSSGVEGAARFLRRVWREFLDAEGRPAAKLDPAGDDDLETSRLLHECIKKITADYESLSFNTVVSQFMILLNHLSAQPRYTLATARIYVQLLAPIAPHIAEELWERLGGTPSVADHPWPKFDPVKLQRDVIKIVVQVNGKLRGEIEVPVTATAADVAAVARAHERVAAHLTGKTLVKEIYVPGKILNLVVR
jgi:leucyl-tRNA synthetase